MHSVCEPADLKNLLQHHKQHRHLEQHGEKPLLLYLFVCSGTEVCYSNTSFMLVFLCAVPPCSMGDGILSSLSAEHPRRVAKATEQHSHFDPLQDLSVDTHVVSFVGDVAVEIIAVTDYTEVELGASTDIEVVAGESCDEGTDGGTEADTQVILPEETTREDETHAAQEKDESDEPNIVYSDVTEHVPGFSHLRVSMGPHDCPDCERKFKFASALTAHKVIHTGERPHRCNECGRCFSFRQSLDRHRHTHKAGRKYECAICGETFHSLSARTEHKQTHTEDGVYACHLCSKTFNWELALARHLKSHSDDHNANQPAESHEDGQEVALHVRTASEAPDALVELNCQVQANDSGDPETAGDQSSGQPTSEPGGLVPKTDDDVTPVVKVRTSGRKRKPTAKVQVFNLQRQMTSKRRKELNKASPPAPKPLLITW